MNTNNIRNGIIGGLVGGLAFGMMMAMMGMLPMIGGMIGRPTALGGWLVHLMISAGIGASFGLLFHRAVRGYAGGLRAGLAYGAVWWLLGPLTLMPWMMGMGFGTDWNLTAAGHMLPSLMGHMIFGVLLGLTYARLSRAAGAVERQAPELRTVGGGN